MLHALYMDSRRLVCQKLWKLRGSMEQTALGASPKTEFSQPLPSSSKSSSSVLLVASAMNTNVRPARLQRFSVLCFKHPKTSKNPNLESITISLHLRLSRRARGGTQDISRIPESYGFRVPFDPTRVRVWFASAGGPHLDPSSFFVRSGGRFE